MEGSSESVFKNSHEEGKLYAVDSLNNLNEHISAVQTQLPMVCEDNIDSNGCPIMQRGIRCQSWYFVTLIIILIVSLALVSFVIILIVHTGEKMDEASRKIILQRRNIDNLKKLNDMILQYFNQTETREEEPPSQY
ncbi:leucine-rich single-pass membrane protein 1 isoform X2 [Pseudonaja textilis]|nr:leucine-rich single-pass membrane protein 1 isoform X2 [Pseudonaja textilis]XP_026568878.1 leucine-rich single-pass membrane protein 1 isoform X2 [Pseudonaja textilis]